MMTVSEFGGIVSVTWLTKTAYFSVIPALRSLALFFEPQDILFCVYQKSIWIENVLSSVTELETYTYVSHNLSRCNLKQSTRCRNTSYAECRSLPQGAQWILKTPVLKEYWNFDGNN